MQADPLLPQRLEGLHGVAARYDAVICDVWGVIHNGRAAFEGACEALRRFRAEHGPVILVTNAPVPKARVTAVLQRLKIQSDICDDVVASGDVARNELQKWAPGPIYPIGPVDDSPVYLGLGQALEFTTDPAAARVVCCTSLRDYPDGEPESYRTELRGLRDRGLAFICANPDIQFRYGDRLIWAAGALAEIYEQEGGQVVRTGKPDRAIYAFAFEQLEAISGRRIDPARILAIGDGPATDLRGAMNEGMDGLFVADGIHGAALAGAAELSAAAHTILTSEGVQAAYVMSKLAW